MVATWNVAAASSYYARQTEYYLGGVEPDGVWYAPAGDLGCTDRGSVDKNDFAALYEGIVRGQKFSDRGGKSVSRVPAYDFTFSAPRSVSLAWAFADDQLKGHIENRHAEAVRSALAIIEREAACARRGKSGTRIEKVTLTVAIFRHSESRPAKHSDGRVFADPNLHSHSVVLNLATRADGTLGALHSTVLRDWKMAAGAVYHSALAEGLVHLGFELDREGYNGTFELKGISDQAIQYFSARREDIKSELAAVGTTSRDASAFAAAVAKTSRNAKLSLGEHKRETAWREAASANTLDDEIGPALGRLHETHRHVVNARQRLADRLKALPAALTQTESVIERRELLRATYAAFVGLGLPTSQADVELDRMMVSRSVIEIGRDALRAPLYSTPEALAVERNLVAIARALASTTWHKVDGSDVEKLCSARGLNEEQIAAARAAVGGSRLAIIEGAPGAGKTTTLAPIVAAYRKTGCRVIGTASAWRIAQTLQSDLQIEARATASWIEKLKHGREFLDKNSLLIVDEAGLLSAREAHTLLSAAHRAGAKVILVGDRRQLQSIGAGPGLDLAARGVAPVRVDTIVRQHHAWARDAVTSFGSGDADTALQAFAAHDGLEEVPSYKDAIHSMVEGWASIRCERPAHSLLLIARTNTQVGDISRAVRAQLRRDGVLAGPEVAIKAVTPSGQGTQIDISAGDQIRFLARNDRLAVVNGTVANVISVHVDRSPGLDRAECVHFEAKIGSRQIRFTPSELADEQGRARLGWAYATTVYGAQGLTVDQALVLLDANYSRQAIHVAASRAREATRLVVDCSQIDTILQSHRPLDQDPGGAPISPDQRRAFLGHRLSVASTKKSALAVLEQSEALEQLGLSPPGIRKEPSHAVGREGRPHQRAREIDHER
ncbi:MobF family relaxase [Xanthobacter sp. 126]|uniref:MobF family relaxase n=1 Tax=Xanthobacter sp. 126 TaxID=1131814 RepID=UPI00045EB101|nr:MobF family relaxase [Xanthobacter sp. 126]